MKVKSNYTYTPITSDFYTIYTFPSKEGPLWKTYNYCIREKALKVKKLYRYTLSYIRQKVSAAPPKKKGEYFIPRTKNLPWKEIE